MIFPSMCSVYRLFRPEKKINPFYNLNSSTILRSALDSDIIRQIEAYYGSFIRGGENDGYRTVCLCAR
jgi:hypothetical protein